MADSSTGAEKVPVNLKHHFVQTIRHCSKNCGDLSEGYRSQLERDSHGPHLDSLSLEKVVMDLWKMVFYREGHNHISHFTGFMQCALDTPPIKEGCLMLPPLESRQARDGGGHDAV